MNDKSRKLAKATHPTIFAYRVVRKAEAGHDPVIIAGEWHSFFQQEASSANLVADNDDDGESAAGGRLAHLLQILELESKPDERHRLVHPRSPPITQQMFLSS